MSLVLGEVLLERYPEALTARYGLNADETDGPGVIEAIAKRRGFRIKGGSPDYEKAAVTLLNDYRGGLLGRITLETPATRAAQLVALAERLREQTQRDSAAAAALSAARPS